MATPTKTAEHVKTQIVKTALAIANDAAKVAALQEEFANRIEDAAWAEILSLRDTAGRPKIAEWTEAIRFGDAAGVLSIEFKFIETTDKDLAKLLWNEFFTSIDAAEVAASRQGMPRWKHELIDTPRATRPDELKWHQKRLKKANFPLKVARLQVGEIFGGQIDWEQGVRRDVDLEWGPGPTGGMGIITDLGECFKGWDDERKLYLGDDDTFENNEVVARIAL